MADWFVGQKVVSVVVAGFWPVKPTVGAIYTIHKISPAQRPELEGTVYLCLEEMLDSNNEFDARGFRPLVNQNTDISELQAVLDRVNNREVVSA